MNFARLLDALRKPRFVPLNVTWLRNTKPGDYVTLLTLSLQSGLTFNPLASTSSICFDFPTNRSHK